MKYSIIIPAYDAANTIGECLNAVGKVVQERGDCEAIVINDGSTDGTAEIVQMYTFARLISQRNAGPSGARNRGVQEARGEIVIFLDSDCVPTENWFTEMVKPFEERADVAGIKGAYLTRQKELAARYIQLEYEEKYRFLRQHEFIDYVDTYSVAFRRMFLGNVAFDPRYSVASTEDADLSFGLAARGARLVFNPEAKVYHKHPSSFMHYFKKKWRFSHWMVLTLLKHPDKAFGDTYSPPYLRVVILLSPCMMFSTLGSLAYAPLIYLLMIFAFIFLITATPVFWRNLQKDPIASLLTIPLLFVRGLIQCAAVAAGLVRFGVPIILSRFKATLFKK